MQVRVVNVASSNKEKNEKSHIHIGALSNLAFYISAALFTTLMIFHPFIIKNGKVKREINRKSVLFVLEIRWTSVQDKQPSNYSSMVKVFSFIMRLLYKY